MSDEIIEELWGIKDGMAREHNYDVRALAASLQGKNGGRNDRMDDLGVESATGWICRKAPKGPPCAPSGSTIPKLGTLRDKIKPGTPHSTSASSGTRDMIRQRIGIDTSVLVRLATGEPPDIHAHCLERLNAMVAGGVDVFASNLVIAESYVTIQRH